MTQPRKPRTAHAKPHAKEKVTEEETVRENAPKLETPEEPSELPEETPRDEDPELETPESPVVSDVEFKKVGLALEGSVAETVSLATGENIQSPEVADLYQHVSQSSTNAHAPVWAPRAPNTLGGYS